MIDPKVTNLTNKLQQQVNEINDTWKQLQDNDCYARIEVSGYSSDEVLQLQLKSVEQKIKYLDSSTIGDQVGQITNNKGRSDFNTAMVEEKQT